MNKYKSLAQHFELFVRTIFLHETTTGNGQRADTANEMHTQNTYTHKRNNIQIILALFECVYKEYYLIRLSDAFSALCSVFFFLAFSRRETLRIRMELCAVCKLSRYFFVGLYLAFMKHPTTTATTESWATFFTVAENWRKVFGTWNDYNV